MKQMVIIDLDELVDPIGQIRHNGNTYDVLPVSGIAFDLSEQIRATGKKLTIMEQLDYTYRIIAELVPSMPEKECRRLTPKQIAAIIGMAGGPVAKVARLADQRAEKNGRAPVRRAKRKGA